MRGLRPEIQAAFQACSIRCTPQRYAIFEYLVRCRSHPTAEQIYRAVNRSDPRASLATVYKALHTMTRAGLIGEMDVGQAVRFEARTEKHHHFVCDRCGRVEDLPWFDLPQLAHRIRQRKRTVRGFELVLRGLCAACAAARRA